MNYQIMFVQEKLNADLRRRRKSRRHTHVKFDPNVGYKRRSTVGDIQSGRKLSERRPTEKFEAGLGGGDQYNDSSGDF